MSDVPPHNPEAEADLLGNALASNALIPELVSRGMRSTMFHGYGNSKICEAMIALSDAGQPADAVTVAEQLIREGVSLDDVGASYLGDLIANRSSGASIFAKFEIVKSYAIDRSLTEASHRLAEMARDRTVSHTEKLADAEQLILGVSELGATNSTAHVSDGLKATYAALDERRTKGNGRFTGLPSGIAPLDAITGGFRGGALIIGAARPGLGKTLLACGIARHAAIEERAPVLFISLEQSREELIERLLCGQGHVDSHRLRLGRVRPAESERIFQAGELLTRSGLHIDDMATQSVTQIAANARRMKRAHGVRLVIVDYLQLIAAEGKSKETRQEQVASISRRLKLLARELGIPVIVLAQLNRQAEMRGDQRPKLSDLRESGALEQDADVVLMLHRSETGQHDGLVDLIVAKHRNGPIGNVRLLWIKQHMRFEAFAMP